MIYVPENERVQRVFCSSIKDYLNSENSVMVLDKIEDFTEVMKTEEDMSRVAVLLPTADDVKKLDKMGVKENVYSISDIEDFLEHMEFFAGKPVLPYIEMHLSDHCNLNCKGCGHLSNIAPEKFADYDQFAKDIYKLKELFSHIKKFRLMGGEPFLNPDLAEFAELVRSENRDTDIRIVTNGLYFGSNSEHTLKRLADLNIQLDISSYPPTVKRKKQIAAILNRFGVIYHFSENINKFLKFRNPDFNKDIHVSYEHCHMKMCTFLRDGEMAACSFPVIYSQLDTFMRGRFAVDSDIIHIHNSDINGWKVTWKLTHPLNSCRYCRTDGPEFYLWEPRKKSEALYADWFVGE